MPILMYLLVQVGQVREVEVRAAKLEGIAEARHVIDKERSQLQQQHQVKLSQLKTQEQQVTAVMLLTSLARTKA